MPSNKILFKIAGALAITAFVLFIIGWTLTSLTKPSEMTDEEVLKQSNQGDLEAITASSSVDNDMDAYLKASSNVPNPNDFNDSYADISQ